MPSIAGTSSRPASVGLAPVVVCRNSGTKTVTENSAAVARNSAALATATVRVRSSWKRDDRIGRAALARDERAAEPHRRGDQREDRRRAPRVARAAPDAREHERAGRAGQQRGAERIEGPAAPAAAAPAGAAAARRARRRRAAG